MAFHVVEFSDGLALVPTNWLSESKSSCFYPVGYTNKKKLYRAVQTAEQLKLRDLSAKWILHDVIRYFSAADTFEKGMEKLKFAEDISDLESDSDDRKKSHHSRHTVILEDAVNENSKSNDDDNDEPKSTENNTTLDQFPDESEFNVEVVTTNTTGAINSSNVLATFDCPIIYDNAMSDDDRIKKIVSSAIKEHETVAINNGKSAIFKKPAVKQDKCINFIMNKGLAEIFRKLNKMMQEIQIIKEDVAEIKENLNNGPNTSKHGSLRIVNRECIDGKKIYIETLDDLDKMENELEDIEFFQKVGTALCQIGGDDIKTITRNVLFQLLSNEIATGFNWAGIRGKKGFKDLNLTKLVRVVVQSQRTATSETEIDSIIGKWLVQAPLRCKRDRKSVV